MCIRYHFAVFRHAVDGFCNVELLVAHRSYSESRASRGRVIANLTGYYEHGNRVEPSADNARYRIRSAGTRRYDESGYFVVNSCICFGSDCARLLMVLIYAVHAFLMSECVV